MSPFVDRFASLEQLLALRRSASEGGWPQKLGMRNAPTTIVATAQVLEILRIRGLEYDNTLVQGGLRYLAEQVRIQTKPEGKPGGRGEWNRYPAYALWGLLRYPLTRDDEEFARGIVFSYQWLRKHALPAGGWSERRDSGPLWLPGTMVAVHALDRLALYSGNPMSSEARALASAAREHIMSEARPFARDQVCWSQTLDGEVCPGATGLATLTLARGSIRHRQAARAGTAWLAANTDQWTHHVHADDEVDDTRWRIMTFSLGLRALLHPCAPYDVQHPAVAEVVQHVDALWKQEHQGWGDRPGLEASVSGSYAVVSAVHTLKRAWPFDPFEHLDVPYTKRAGSVAAVRSGRVLLVARAGNRIRIDDASGDTFLETTVRGRSQWAYLLTLAERHHQNEGSGNQSKMAVSVDELATLTANGRPTRPESVIRTIRRLNQSLKREAKMRTKRTFVNLIDPHTPPGTEDRWFALEEMEVRFVDTLPIESADSAR